MYNIRICAGEEGEMNKCLPGTYPSVLFVDGGFGPLGSSCTSTATCTTSDIQIMPPDITIPISFYISPRCDKNSNTCTVLVSTSWRSSANDCNNHRYRIIYVDVRYICYPRGKRCGTYCFKFIG